MLTSVSSNFVASGSDGVGLDVRIWPVETLALTVVNAPWVRIERCWRQSNSSPRPDEVVALLPSGSVAVTGPPTRASARAFSATLRVGFMSVNAGGRLLPGAARTELVDTATRLLSGGL